MSFKAKYAGNCACCLKRFQIGDEVSYVDEQIVIESHVLALVDTALGNMEQMCPVCFLIQPKHRFPGKGEPCASCRD